MQFGRLIGRKFVGAALGLALMATSGCGGNASPVTSDKSAADKEVIPSPPEARPAASEVLRKLLKTYREAKSYSDEGEVVLRRRQSGDVIENKWKSAIRFERPNRLFALAFQVTIGCDGKELRGRIEDEATGDVDGQILVRPAPKELKLKDLAADPLLYDILTSQIRRQPIQLELLLESQGLASAFRGDVACKLLEDAKADGEICERVEVPSPGGSFVFWVDAKNGLLRRLEYPAAALVPALAQDPTVSDLSLTAEMKGAQLNPIIPAEKFVLAIPTGAKKMKSLVMPPQPLPSDLFGQQVGEFFLTQLDGEKLPSKDLAGKIAVLTWFHNSPSCAPILAQVEQARQELGQNSKVAFYAVSTDPTDLGNDDLAKLLSSWSVEMPVVRDLELFGKTLFKMEVHPTIIVLSGDGRVQIVQAGGGPDLARHLGVILERLLKGDDVAAEIVKRAEMEKVEYARLISVGGPEPAEFREIPETVIHKRTEPKRLKLEEIWTNKQIKSPGNISVITAEGQPDRLVVFSGWRAVSELSAAGKLLANHELPIPAQAAVTYLRTAKDAAGKRVYLAAAPLSPAFFLLDENWELALTYPADGSLSQLGDAQLARLAGTQELMVYAGYVDLGGLQAISLEGKAAWRSRTIPNVLSAAIAPGKSAADPGAELLITGDSGAILRVSGSGKEQPPQSVEKFAIDRIVSANFSQGTQSRYLAIASGEKGEAVAIGLDASLKRRWHYPLPPGGHLRPIEPIASGELLPGRAGTWAIAGPDGSIHIISEDGELTDSFYYGACITGIAIGNVDAVPMLLVATDEGVTARKLR
ncbi:MAG: peroxiredoxin family protein [Pirellulaceae bacterium]